MPASTLKYIAPADVTIEGVPTEGMTIRAATGRALGRLEGFIVDAAEQHIRYFIVRRPEWFGKTRVLPLSTPRVDLDERTIEVDLNDQELWQLRSLSPDALIA